MSLSPLYDKALRFEALSIEEGMELFEQAPLTDLMAVADELRKVQVPHGTLPEQALRRCVAENAGTGLYHASVPLDDDR